MSSRRSGLDLKVRDNLGKAVLHMATEHSNSSDICELPIDAGASLTYAATC